MLDSIELDLLLGKPINIGIGNVYPLTIKEIIEIGENIYNLYLKLLLYDVDLLDINNSVLEEIGVDKFTTYHFLVLQSFASEEFKNLVIKAFQCFLRNTVDFNKDYLIFYLVDENGNKKPITLEVYNLFRKVLIKQHYLKDLEEEEELEFGNKLARQWYLNIKKKEKMRPKSKSDINLQSLISAIRWKSNKSKEEILQMTIYELWDGLYRLYLIDNCQDLSQGIYFGTVDKDKVKSSDLNWAKVIVFNNGLNY